MAVGMGRGSPRARGEGDCRLGEVLPRNRARSGPYQPSPDPFAAFLRALPGLLGSLVGSLLGRFLFTLLMAFFPALLSFLVAPAAWTTNLACKSTRALPLSTEVGVGRHDWQLLPYNSYSVAKIPSAIKQSSQRSRQWWMIGNRQYDCIVCRGSEIAETLSYTGRYRLKQRRNHARALWLKLGGHGETSRPRFSK
jgi:hypothetical protein